MITALMVAIVVLAARRGHRRGAPGELIDLLIVMAAIPIAFRAGGSIGERLFADWAPLASRTLGALVVFGAVTLIGLAVQRLTEVEVTDRPLGALIGAVRGSMVALVAVAIVAAAPIGTPIGQAAQESAVVDAVGNPDGPAMRLFAAATGEDGMLALISFNRRAPDSPLLNGDERQIPSFATDQLTDRTDAGADIFELVNVARADAGVSSLSWSSALTAVAQDYANEIYRTGRFDHFSPSSGDVGDRLAISGIAYRLAGENLALAPNVGAVHDGLMNSQGHRANIVSIDYSHIGVGVVEGPIGLVVVQVFLGG